MAGRGRAPSERLSRERDQKRREAEQTVVQHDDEVRGPDLPDEFAWCSRTRQWWDLWRRSPQAQAFIDTDWDFLLDTAMLHHEFWSGNASVAAELRLRVAKYGATPEDRARLRMQVAPQDAKPAAEPRPTSSTRRSRLLKVVDGGEG